MVGNGKGMQGTKTDLCWVLLLPWQLPQGLPGHTALPCGCCLQSNMPSLDAVAQATEQQMVCGLPLVLLSTRAALTDASLRITATKKQHGHGFTLLNAPATLGMVNHKDKPFDQVSPDGFNVTRSIQSVPFKCHQVCCVSKGQHNAVAGHEVPVHCLLAGP